MELFFISPSLKGIVMPRKIAICSQKGGVGKTTTAVNLAAALAGSGNRVLLVDTDSQCSATISCGYDKKSVGLSVYDLLVNPGQSPAPIVRKCDTDLLWLLPGSPSLVSAEIELVKEMGREFIFKEKMEEIVDDYDFIIVDCTPGVSLLVLNALFFCDEVILPVQSQFLAPGRHGSNAPCPVGHHSADASSHQTDGGPLHHV